MRSLLPVLLAVFGNAAVRLVVAAVALVAVVRLTTSPEQLWLAASRLEAPYLVLATVLMPVGILLQWYRWHALLHDALPGLPGAHVWRSLLAGFGLGLLTPGRLGELGRGVALPGRAGAATGLAVADRLLSSSVTLAAGCVTAFVLLSPVLAAACGAGVAAIFGGLSLARGRLTTGAWFQPLRCVRRRTWALCALAALGFNLVFFSQLLLLLRAGGDLPPGTALAIPGVFALKTLLPVSFLDLGIREGAAVFVLAGVGVDATVAVQASLLLVAINVLLPGVAGLLSLGLRAPAGSTATPIELVHVR